MLHQDSQKKTQFDHLFKILLIGDPCVGKSSLLLRYSDDVFADQYMSTIGVDFKIKTLRIDEKKWDTAGQERFKTITTTYYKGAQGIIVVYDITEKQSFRNVENWFKEIKNNAQKNILKLLVGNKSDLEEKRCVSYDVAKSWAEANDIHYIETSAKTGEHVIEAFYCMAKQLIEYSEQQQEESKKQNDSNSTRKRQLNETVKLELDKQPNSEEQESLIEKNTCAC